MKSVTTSSAVLDSVLGGDTYVPAAGYQFALYTVAPTQFGGGTEVSGGGYARVSVANNATTFPDAVSGVKSLGIQVAFPTATGDWGTVVAWGLHSASGDNLVMFGALGSSVVVTTGDTPTFAVGSIIFSES